MLSTRSFEMFPRNLGSEAACWHLRLEPSVFSSPEPTSHLVQTHLMKTLRSKVMSGLTFTQHLLTLELTSAFALNLRGTASANQLKDRCS